MAEPTLVVGMPIFERAWITPVWFKSLEANLLAPKENTTLCFAYSKGFDGTYEQLMYYGEQYKDLLIYEFDLPTYSNRENMARFHELAALRNGLLNMVREVGPDYFLSWDNDILFPKDRLQVMMETAAPDRAVGALMDMGGREDDMAHPSVMEFGQTPAEPAYRKAWTEYAHDRPFKCDVIMAVKLMGKEVYENTSYRWDMVGEDIGWCHSCEENGYARYLEPRAHGYHIYDKDAAIRCMKANADLEFPEILEPLHKWYEY